MTRRALIPGSSSRCSFLSGWHVPRISGNVYLIGWTLLMPAVALLVALLIANSFLRRSKRIAPLSRAELLCIYLIVSASLPVAGFGMIRFLVLNLGNTFFFSTPENKWGEMQEHLPAWMVPNEPVRAFAGFYRGYSTPPWGDWLVPIVVWSVYIALLVGRALLHAAHPAALDRRGAAHLSHRGAAAGDDAAGGRLLPQPASSGRLPAPFIGQSLLALNALFPSVPAFQIKAKWYPVFNLHSPGAPLGAFRSASTRSPSGWPIWFRSMSPSVAGSSSSSRAWRRSLARWPATPRGPRAARRRVSLMPRSNRPAPG